MDWMYQELWFIPCRSKRCFSSLKCPDQLWNPHSLLFNGNQGFFPLGINLLNPHTHTLLRLRMSGAILHPTTCLHTIWSNFIFSHFSLVYCKPLEVQRYRSSQNMLKTDWNSKLPQLCSLILNEPSVWQYNIWTLMLYHLSFIHSFIYSCSCDLQQAPQWAMRYWTS